MIKLHELETLKEAYNLTNLPALKEMIVKYTNAREKIKSKTKPLLEGELYELKVIKGLSVREIIKAIKLRRGVSYSRSTIEKAIRIEGLVGKGRTAIKFRENLERNKNQNV